MQKSVRERKVVTDVDKRMSIPRSCCPLLPREFLIPTKLIYTEMSIFAIKHKKS